MKMDQLIIGEKASFDDFGASVASRKIKMPKKKVIKETVPFSNITYDFSAINGEIYWEERELEYVFEITAETPERLEELKTAFASWVASAQEAELHDPFIPDYHFRATYEDMTPEDDEGMDKTTLTVKFTAYPYMIANVAKPIADVVYKPGGLNTTTITNPYGREIIPTFLAEGGKVFVLTDEYSLELEADKPFTDRNCRLKPGDTEMQFAAFFDPPCERIRITWIEEVL